MKNWDQQFFIDLQENDLPQCNINKLETSGNKGQEGETDKTSFPGSGPCLFLQGWSLDEELWKDMWVFLKSQELSPEDKQLRSAKKE